MWTWCRILKISWTEKVTNEEVLVHASEARSILKMIWCSKHRWLGHVLRHENLLHDIIIGKMLGKDTQSKKRMELLHDMMEGKDYRQLKDLISEIKMETGQQVRMQKLAGNCRRLKRRAQNITEMPFRPAFHLDAAEDAYNAPYVP